MVDKIDKRRMAQNYGFALAFLNSSPEISRLFSQAVKESWTADRFTASLRDTKWFQRHSASFRNAILQEASDPESYRANVDQMYSTVRDAWGNLFGGETMDEKDLRRIAETAHRMGWSQAELVDRLTKGQNYRKLLGNKKLGGSAAQAEGQLDALTRNYGLDLGKNWKAAQVKKLLNGDDTIEGVQQRVRDEAARQYRAFADRIQGGETVMEIASPYMQKMADLLELNPEDINLQDKTIQRALNARTDSGEPAAMDLASFADEVRKDVRWQYTDNARQRAEGVGRSLLQLFGKGV